MKPPCEVIANSILPAIRSLLVKDLAERHKFNQVEIAKKLGITQPAVSQYRRKLRGSNYAKIINRKDIVEKIRKLSDSIASGKNSHCEILEMYCKICKEIRKKEIICVLHAETAPYLKKEDCRVCLD